MTEQLLLRPEEAARALGVSRSRMFELLATGKVRSVIVGKRSRRITHAALAEYVATLEFDEAADEAVRLANGQ